MVSTPEASFSSEKYYFGFGFFYSQITIETFDFLSGLVTAMYIGSIFASTSRSLDRPFMESFDLIAGMQEAFKL